MENSSLTHHAQHNGEDRVPEPESSAQTLCPECFEVLSETKETDRPWTDRKTVCLHQNFSALEECGNTRCKFCHFIYNTFVDELNGSNESHGRISKILSVKAWIRHLHIGESRLVESMVLELNAEVEGDWKYIRRHFALLGNSARSLKRAIWSFPGPVDFRARAPTIKSWLAECVNEHPDCRKSLTSDKLLAARILEVRSGPSGPLLRLIPTSKLDLHRTPYFVLSHCWGEVEVNCKTTTEKIADYQNSIPLTSLTKTFREAVEITLALGIPYLWIDSLCIIQNDTMDWELESAKMAAIYRGALMTISASSARNSHEGCGITNLQAPATQFRLAQPGRRPPYFAIRPTSDEVYKSEMFRLAREAPVNKRAWIFQEKILSRRILNATHEQFVWQCATHVETEDGLIYGKDRRRSSPWEILRSQDPDVEMTKESKEGDMQACWWDWARDYMDRNLKHPSDMYAALAGVTALYQELTGDEPVLGMWKRYLIFHLSWEARKNEDTWKTSLERQPRPRRPSWTWMSYLHGSMRPSVTNVDWEMVTSGKPERPIFSPRTIALVYQAEVLDVDIQWTGVPLVTAPSWATLRLRGLRRRLPKPSYLVAGEPGNGMLRNGKLSLDPEKRGAYKSATEFDVLTLFAFTREGDLINPPQLHMTHLLLEAAESGESEYVRIGIALTWIDLPPGTEIEEVLLGTYQEITLV